MKKTIDFIIGQQAQITAAMGRLTETVERLSLKVDRNADGVAGLLAVAEIHDRQMKETDRQMKETDRQMKETDERLNALINTVERHISEGRNGRA